jgi:protein-disulfide isomerase
MMMACDVGQSAMIRGMSISICVKVKIAKMVRTVAILLALATPLAAQDTKLAERAAMNRVKGNQNAGVVVYEFADFQCPYCARFAREVFPRIDSAYVKTGKVLWVFVNIPLPNHANSWAAAEAAMCAGAVAERFWPLHDKLFMQQAEWSPVVDPSPLLTKYAREAGVPNEAFQACVAADLTASLLVRDVLYASNARVSGTPAFVINNEPIFVGMKTFAEWTELLEAALKKPLSK